jgi:hypothetical protein
MPAPGAWNGMDHVWTIPVHGLTPSGQAIGVRDTLWACCRSEDARSRCRTREVEALALNWIHHHRWLAWVDENRKRRRELVVWLS